MFVVALLQVTAPAQSPKESSLVNPSSPKGVVQGFIDTVRSGRTPERASEFLADQVSAHQLNSEGETTVVRTPASYAEHVHEFLNMYGRYQLTVTELISDGDRVYVRWRQEGKHLGSIQGFAPTGLPIVEITNAVYRVKDGKIVEYWIQADRKGVELQLRVNAAKDQASR
ncbi:ester cyclase [Terriglobus albidus]|uniref:Ester cyclase n=2 Tax=Terriglobus albidus TaxID=1592106 RepID=A0A5B9EK71_9BACT|nr:ester cyclase [Terriglobus albidus]